MSTLVKLCLAAVMLVKFSSSAPVFPLDIGSDMALDRSDLFEGDIAGIDVLAVKRNGILSPAGRWADGVVPYTIDSKFSTSEQETIKKAMDGMNSKTNIKLVPRKTERDYIAITKGASNSGCYSYVGKTGGQQSVNLETGTLSTCVRHGIIQHEINHAIGFFHEQSRTDRDQFVEINFDNIPRQAQGNFEKYGSGTITPLNTTYDYGSLMHYGKFDFAIKSNVYTIRPKAPNQNATIGQRSTLSAIDIQRINTMYPIKQSRMVEVAPDAAEKRTTEEPI